LYAFIHHDVDEMRGVIEEMQNVTDLNITGFHNAFEVQKVLAVFACFVKLNQLKVQMKLR